MTYRWAWILGVLTLACAGEEVAQEEGDIANTRDPLIVNQIDGVDDKWNATEAVNLTYCVSKDFGANYMRAVHEVYQATIGWESAAYVKFRHLASHDSNCVTTNNDVTFVVRPRASGSAAAFFPNTARTGTDKLLDLNIAFYDSTTDGRTSRGAFLHEMGHTIGFRHEHIRPEAPAACSDENDSWRSLTDYDSESVMHYRSCVNRVADYVLTATDRTGAYALYPAPSRCEVWNGTVKLGQTTMSGLTSAAGADSACKSWAKSNYQANGVLFDRIERRSDHVRALMIPSSSTPCAYDTDTVIAFSPGIGFAPLRDRIRNYSMVIGQMLGDVPGKFEDGLVTAYFGFPSGGYYSYLYDTSRGFLRNGLERSVSFCGDDDATSYEVRRTDGRYGVPVQNGTFTLKPLAYNGYSLGIDGMGGNDTLAGGLGRDSLYARNGTDTVYGYDGNDVIRVCGATNVDCGAGTDTVYRCATYTGTIAANCENVYNY